MPSIARSFRHSEPSRWLEFRRAFFSISHRLLCSSTSTARAVLVAQSRKIATPAAAFIMCASPFRAGTIAELRSEEHTSELQTLMRISYTVFRLKKKYSHNIYSFRLNKVRLNQ